MKGGEHVKFKTFDCQEEWQSGILVRYDKFLNIGEIMVEGGFVFYAPRRLIESLELK